jgi:hypothetical protein
VRGKGGRRDRLPLPQDVGQALVTYLSGVRSRCATRRVFVRMKATQRGFANSVAICTIVRHALGFKLQTVGITLRQFVHFADQEGATFITTDLALRWATQPQSAQPTHWATRLGMVRRFAQYCQALDSRTEIVVFCISPRKGIFQSYTARTCRTGT